MCALSHSTGQVCGALNEGSSHRIICLNVSFPVDGLTIKDELRGMALMKEVCLWEWALKPHSMLTFALSWPATCRSDVSSQPLL